MTMPGAPDVDHAAAASERGWYPRARRVVLAFGILLLLAQGLSLVPDLVAWVQGEPEAIGGQRVENQRRGVSSMLGLLGLLILPTDPYADKPRLRLWVGAILIVCDIAMSARYVLR